MIIAYLIYQLWSQKEVTSSSLREKPTGLVRLQNILWLRVHDVFQNVTPYSPVAQTRIQWNLKKSIWINSQVDLQLPWLKANWVNSVVALTYIPTDWFAYGKRKSSVQKIKFSLVIWNIICIRKTKFHSQLVWIISRLRTRTVDSVLTDHKIFDNEVHNAN